MKPILETMDTPVWGEYDVVVVGGGVAGVSAAVAARRAGASRVLLLEKSIQFGGMATQGLISLYEPLCNAHGKKVTYGMAEELMLLCRRYGPDDLPAVWDQNPDFVENCTEKYWAHFSPAVFTLALDAFVTEAGVEVLFDTRVVRPVMNGKRVEALIVENRDGRGAFAAKTVIDATGDANILQKVGVPCVDGKNYMTYIAYVVNRDTLQKASETGNMLYARKWTRLGSGPFGNGQPEGMPTTACKTAEELTQYVLYGRKMLLDTIKDGDRMLRDVSCLPAMPQLREIRRVESEYVVTESDCKTPFADSVGVVADFGRAGDWYEVPYRALYHASYPNIWAAGRIIGASDWAWTVLRVIPGCAVSGQAAGTAAALSVQRNETAGSLSMPALTQALMAGNARIHVQ